ncbi:MAG: TVP38/TMEM64 family protein [Clostridia bacterium]
MQYKGVSALIFIAIQFLQVTIIPIPSTITTMAGGIIFGFWKSFFYSLVGIISGSMFAFFLGRKFGTKLAVWIFGEKLFNKYQVALKGKDKFLMFMMFILPFFPDDLICILAGLTDMKYWGFFAMMLVVRPIGIATVSGAFNGIMAIPFEGWGIALWLAIAVAFVVFVALVWKYGGKIQDKFLIIIEKIKIKIASKKNAKSPNKANVTTNSNGSNFVTSTRKNKQVQSSEAMASEPKLSKKFAIEESPIDEREQNLPQKIKHIYELENSTKTTIIAHSNKKNSSTNSDIK